MSVTLNSFEFQQPSPSSFTVTVPSLTSGGVVVIASVDNGSNTTLPTAMTIGGVSLTLLDSGTVGEGGVVGGGSFYGTGIPSGSQTAVITIGGGVTSMSVRLWYLDNGSGGVNAHNRVASTGTGVVTSVSTFGIGALPAASATSATPISHQSGASFGMGQDSNGMLGAGTITNVWSGGTGSNGFVVFVQNAAAGPANVKTWDGVTQSTGIKTYFGVALASVKSVNGVS